MSGRAESKRFWRAGMLIRRLVLLLLLVCPLSLLPAKTQLKVSAATGWQSAERGGKQTLTRCGFSLKTRQALKNYFIRLQGRISPEFFGSGSDATSAFKISGSLSLERNTRQGRWLVHLTNKKFFYSLSQSQNISFDLLLGGLSFSRPAGKGRRWFAALNYWSRQNQTRPGTQVNAVQFNTGQSRQMSAVRISFRLLTEYFTVRPRYDASERRINRGWRCGPYAGWSYRKRFVFQGSLFYLYHYSLLTKKPANEWGGELVLGNVFHKRWSAFLYGRYQHISSFPRELPPSLLYAPADLENWLYGKVAFDVRRNWELFLKTGWLKDNLPATDNLLESTYAVIGVQWHK